MKNNLVANLRASVFALSAASLAVTVPAFAQPSANQQGANNQPQFTQLDQNDDRKLNQEELQSFAEDKQMDAEQFLSRFDRNNDDTLDRNEFAQLSREAMSDTKNRMAGTQSEQNKAEKPDGPKVVVDQKPTQINVEKPPAQVSIDQPKPKVTITTQDPKVEVEQAEPRVSVQQGEPEVSVDQAKPEVEVQDADPEVQVSRSEPQVDVNQQEPEVSYEAADNQQQNLQANRQAEQQSMERGAMAAQSEQQSSNQSAAADDEIYTRPINELRSAEVVDQQGETLGNVAEVVVKRDSSEAGFIISTAGTDGEQRHIYRAAEDFSLEGEEIVFTEEPETLTEPQGFTAQDFVAASGDEQRTLNDLINREGLSAR